MSGTTIQLFSRRNFEFSDLAADGAMDIQVLKAVDVSQYTSGTLEVRVHSNNIASGGAINVLAYTTAPTAEAPATDFVRSTTPVASVAIAYQSPTAPALSIDALDSNFGGTLTVVVQGVQPGSPVNIQAELSAFLTLKS